MRIVLIVEGKTEKAFVPFLRHYLEKTLSGRMPELQPHIYNGLIPTSDKLRRIVGNFLNDRSRPVDHVIALTDVYTGQRPPLFENAMDAKRKMRQWVPNEPRFHPHAAQHDFEAWLLPYWPTIQKLAKHNQSAPPGTPESVNHNKPPSYWIKEIFSKSPQRYVKPREVDRILKDKDLSMAINQCPELKDFVNTILKVCGGQVVP